MFKSIKYTLLILCFTLSNVVSGQCAMCRAVLESESGQSSAEGVNDGIVYLMSIPYILVGAIGLLMYFKFFRKKPSNSSV